MGEVAPDTDIKTNDIDVSKMNGDISGSCEEPEAMDVDAGSPVTPTESLASPARSAGSPSRSMGSPARSAGSPSRSMGSPARSIGSPARSIGSPAMSVGSQARSTGSPTRSRGSPARSESSQTRYLGSPARSARSAGSPARSESSPARSEGSPARSEGSPARSEGSPARSEVSPARSKGSPARSECSPARSTGSPTRSADSPARSVETAVRSVESRARSAGSPTRSIESPAQSMGSQTRSAASPERSVASPARSKCSQPGSPRSPAASAGGSPLPSVSTTKQQLLEDHDSDSSDSSNTNNSSMPSNVKQVNGTDSENSADEDDPPEKNDSEGEILIADSDEEDDEHGQSREDSVVSVEPMDVDAVSNGVENDDPVSINSDSEPENIDDVPKPTNETINLNESDDIKTNGEVCISPEVHEIESDKEDVVEIPSTPKKKKKPAAPVILESPRRSSRNINRKSYIEDKEDDDPDLDDPPEDDDDDEVEEVESDIEEVTEMDPLSDPLGAGIIDVTSLKKPGPRSKSRPQIITNNISSNSTIVVKDTKRLIEITTKVQSPSTVGKKSPTLVIIDANSILSGRGAMSSKTIPSSTANYSVLPVAVPAQGVYPVNMRATITPVPVSVVQAPRPALPPPPPILPSLTDDMFVVEAPSFIVPYVYEKPPVKPFREFVENLGKEVEEMRIKEEKEKAEKEKAELERKKNEKPTEEKENGVLDPDAKVAAPVDGQQDKKKSKKKRKKVGDDDESWDEASSSDSSDSEPEEKIEKEVLVQEIREDSLDGIKEHIITPETVAVKPAEKRSDNYFENPLGKFFMNIGVNLVQEHVQADLLKQQKRKRDREGKKNHANSATQQAINSLIKNLEFSKENNQPFHFAQKRCEFCNFKTESAIAMEHHMETPHMRNYLYRCNFCTFEIRSPHDILFHMEAEHNTRGRLERAPAYHQCPNCPFEDNGKGKLTRHFVTCAKKYKPDANLAPPSDWEPPAKIPRSAKSKHPNATNPYHNIARLNPMAMKLPQGTAIRGRGRPQLASAKPMSTAPPGSTILRGGIMYRQAVRPGTSGGGQVLIPTSYQYSGNQLIQVVGSPLAMLPGSGASGSGTVTIQTAATTTKAGNKLMHQPSISITPLPRQTSIMTASPATSASAAGLKPGMQPAGKASFVICEICDGYIKDLDQLRNHMQWIHKVKIHPKMIYNRPPLNCQKCQFRFFTDQGLERHLLGSHGLVTSSMQEAANKGKDAGRCPVCGRVYQWKLLNHVARDHSMTLKPAHLSYKCTVCTATFGMYKQFENHVYSAHSVVAKKVMDKKGPASVSPKSSGDSLLKPLKINDEITIIPQPPKIRAGPASRTNSPAAGSSKSH